MNFPGLGGLSVGTRLLAFLLAGLFLVLGVLSFLVIERERTLFLSVEMEKTRLMAEDVLGEILEIVLVNKDPEEIKHMIDAHNLSGQIQVALFRGDGSLYYGRPGRAKMPAEVLSKGVDVSRKAGGEFVLYKPIHNESACFGCHDPHRKLRGVLGVYISTSKADAQIKGTMERMAVFAVAAIFLMGLALAFIIRKLFLVPLSRLKKGVETIGSGNLRHRIAVESGGEFGSIAREFNLMAGRVENSRRHLQDEVSRQTRDLRAVAELSYETFRGDISLDEILEIFLGSVISKLGYEFCALYFLDKANCGVILQHSKGEGVPACDETGTGLKTKCMDVMLRAEPSVSTPGGSSAGYIAFVPVIARRRKRCREVHNCSRKECAAYDNQDERCWLIQCGDESGGDRPKKMEKCLCCEAFPVLGILLAGGALPISGNRTYSLEIIASEMAAAVENYHLIDRQKRDIKELVRLHDLSVRSFKSLDMPELYGYIVSAAVSFSGADAAVLWVAEKGKLLSKDSFRVDRAKVPGAVELESGMARSCSRGSVLEKTDISGVDFLRELAAAHGFGYLALVPLKDKEGLAGCITLFKKQPVLMTDSERAITMLYSSQAVSFIKTARLYDELKSQKELLQESEEKHRKLVETSNDAILLVDSAKGVIINANRKSGELLGRDQGGILGRSPVKFHPAEKEPVYRRLYEGDEWTGRPISGYVCRGETLVPVEISSSRFSAAGRELMQIVFRDITERKQAEDALRESEEKFRSLAETTTSGIFICREKLVYANPSTEKITGCTKEELAGMAFAEFIHPDFQAGLAELKDRCLDGSEARLRAEFKIITKEKEEKWVDLTANSIMYQGGPAMMCTVFDVTERKLVEEALRESSQGIISSATGEFFFRLLVQYLVKALGVDYAFVGELSGSGNSSKVRTVALCHNGEIAENIEYKLRNSPCETVFQKEIRCYGRDVKGVFPRDRLLSELGIESYMGIPLRDSSGQALGLMVVMDGKPADDTGRAESLLRIFATRASAELERRHSEEEQRRLIVRLKDERNFSDAIFNSTASGVMVLHGNGTVLRINQPGLEILEMEPEDVIGKDISSIDPSFSRVMETRAGVSGEVVLNRGGKVKPIGFTNSLLRLQKEEKRGVIAVFRDLTEIVRLRGEIRRKQHFESMGKVISGVAHEIRNPLFAVQSIGQLLEREISSPQHLALIEAMLKETRRMKSLIEELLLYSRPSKLNLTEVDLSFFFEEVLKLVMIRNSRVLVSLGIPPHLKLRADKDKLKQVFLNLLDNADGASAGKIDISASERDGAVYICVEDDGKGIKPEDMDRIFDPFFTTKKEGTGLGLPICKKIIEDHGGTLEIKSPGGHGAAVTIAIPKSPA
ncbi:MAG: PAS domain S-box protein [Nitrospiraceae bacterium]|nr:PAS domain S-box protein [Nitrospiraceae bacterium]